MRVCHITTLHSADDPRIFYRLASGVAARNLSVVIIAPSGTLAGSPVQTSRWNGRIGRARRLQRIGLALRAALAEHADVYLLHNPELIPAGLVLKALKPSSAVVYDAMEDYPSYMLVKHWLPKRARPWLARSMRAAHHAAGRCFDGIVTADPGVASDFQAVAGHKTIVYYNFPPLSLFEATSDEQPSSRSDLVYIGGMSDRSGTFVLLDALTVLRERGVRPSLRMAGYTDGEAGRQALEEGIRSRCLETQVELRGRMPYSRVPAWIRGGRIGLVTLQPIAKFMKNIPSKAFDYWAGGLPVVASELPPISEFLSENRNGLLFSPESASDLARAIQFLLERPHEIEAMGRVGLRLVHEKWNNDEQVDGLICFYQRILQR